ncbi:MAG: putative transcriptional regulator [Microbacterium sp.]|jgi:hypothetical protein|nr:putative transcriptional regulator [Microbacterium sp.]
MPPLLFDDQALAIALRAAPALGAGIGEAAVRALATTRQVLPSRLRHRLDAIEATTVGRPDEAQAAAVPLDVLLTLAQAVRDRVTVRFDYLSRDGMSRSLGGSSRTTSLRRTAGGICSGGISTAATGASSPPSGSNHACRTAPPSCRGSCPAVMSTPSFRGGSRDRMPTGGRAGER